MNKKDIIQFFNTLPNYNSQEFSLKITQEILTSSTDVETLVNLLKEILDEYKNRDNSIINNKKLAFAACYALIVLYRRYDEQFKIKKLTDDFNSLFEDIPLFISEKSRICVEIGNNNDLKKALKLGKKSIELLEGKEHAGIFNNYSEIIALNLEKNTKKSEELLEEGYKYIFKAKDINKSYAKYYYTLARLQIIDEKYDDAEKNLKYAIEIEDMRMMDYSIRLSRYRNYLLVCHMMKLNKDTNQKMIMMNEEYSKVKMKLENSQLKMLEVLSLLVAIIGLMIAGISFSLKFKLNEAIILICVLNGLVFIDYGLLKSLCSANEKKELKYVILVGLLIITIGLLVGIFLKKIPCFSIKSYLLALYTIG